MLKTKHRIELASMLQKAVMAERRLLGKGPETRVRRGGVNWDLDLREGIDFSISLLGVPQLWTVRCGQRLLHGGR